MPCCETLTAPPPSRVHSNAPSFREMSMGLVVLRLQHQTPGAVRGYGCAATKGRRDTRRTASSFIFGDEEKPMPSSNNAALGTAVSIPSPMNAVSKVITLNIQIIRRAEDQRPRANATRY